LGLDRAKVLARALQVHPSVLASPDWEIESKPLLDDFFCLEG
jgi:hypothetical protein